MSAQREWKPGDVVAVANQGSGLRNLRGIVVSNPSMVRGWAVILPDRGREQMAFGEKELRPLAVIDPEDREQADRLFRLWCDSLGGPAMGEQVDAMQAALRDFANPTAPEPRNDGALIECDYDGKHGRAVRLGGSWTFYGDALRDSGAIYEDFTNVRVLSEGVTDAD